MADVTLSAGEIAGMRTTLGSFLPGTAVISTATNTSDSQGGFTQAFAASGTVTARLSPLKPGDERIVGDRVAEVGWMILTVPYHTSIDEDDRVTYNSVTYEVAEVLTRVPWELGRRVVLVELD